jgi:hypothetical protein
MRVHRVLRCAGDQLMTGWCLRVLARRWCGGRRAGAAGAALPGAALVSNYGQRAVEKQYRPLPVRWC